MMILIEFALFTEAILSFFTKYTSMILKFCSEFVNFVCSAVNFTTSKFIHTVLP